MAPGAVSDEPLFEWAEAVVVDTDVLSFWQRRDTRGADYDRALTGKALTISFQTVAEQYRWAAERDWGQVRRDELVSLMAQFTISSLI